MSTATASSRPVSYADANVRSEFIRRTYTHLAFAILGFLVVENMLLSWSGAPALISMMMGYGWLFVMIGFMGVSWLADKWARSDASPNMQYLGLGLYIVAEAVIFLPMLYIASNFSSPDVIPTAGLMTSLLFLGLTFTAFTTKKDFSFLRGMLSIGGFIAMGVIVCSILFGFSLGLFFSTIMVAYAAGSILYTTSNIIHHYRPDQHVAASLALFAGVALLFWYVLQILMSLGGDD
jgi:FtsH-binding integral membrane protein